MNPEIKRILRFITVGGTGFAVDAAVLKMLLISGLTGPFSARIFSIALAGLVTWQLNRNFTFAPSGDSQLNEAARYGSVVAISSSINYVIYAGLLLAIPSLEPLLALVAASIGAMVFSFVGYDRFVFWNTSRRVSNIN